MISKQILLQFHCHLLEQEKCGQTIKKYLRDVQKLKNFLGEKEISKANLLDFKQELIREFKPASVNSILAAVNKYLDFLGRTELKIKPLRLQKMIFRSEEKEIKKTEYFRLLETAKNQKNERLMLIVETISASGIRISELKFITAEAVRIGRAEVRCKGKFRVVFLPKKLCEILRNYIKKQKITAGAVFVTRNGNPIDRSNIWRGLKKLADDAKVEKEKVFPHNFRHFFARIFYSKEKDLVRLADILGHSSVNTTRIYTVESGFTHKRQLERLNLILTE